MVRTIALLLHALLLGGAGARSGARSAPPSLGPPSAPSVPSVELPDGTTLDMAHGTTTLSFVFDGGIIAAVDSRASLGKLVGSRTTDKVLPVTGHILGTMAGGAADCQYWIRALSAQVRLWELTEGSRATASAAANMLTSMLRQNRGAGLSVGTMIMGHGLEDEPCIFYLDDSGACVKGNMFSVGSGSSYAIGVLDAEHRPDMSVEEAADLAVRAIQRATHRDAFSGGYINVFHLTAEGGWRQIRRLDSAALPNPSVKADAPST